MACRIGITTDLEERQEYWEREYNQKLKFEILGEHDTQEEAQDAEDKFVEEHGCEGSAGGRNVENAIWYVYKFEFTE